MIRLYGLEPDRDIRIEYTGLRPGEKLYEEIVYGMEDLVPTANGKIFIMKALNQSFEDLESFITQIPLVSQMNPPQIREMLRSVVKEFVSSHDHPASGETRLVR
jgi:FlaA1/EpsC-like NDP-sugar epimerase